MATMKEVCVSILVDNNGDYVVGTDDDTAREKYVEDIGSLDAIEGFRIFRVTLSVPLPEAIEMSAEVPDDMPATPELKVV